MEYVILKSGEILNISKIKEEVQKKIIRSIKHKMSINYQATKQRIFDEVDLKALKEELKE